MKKFIVAMSMAIVLGLNINVKAEEIMLIPTPQKITVAKGELTFDAKSKILVSDKKYLPIAKILSRNISIKTGVKPGVTSKDSSNVAIKFEIDNTIPKEGYTLEIDKQVVLKASDYQGAANGSATIFQLIGAKKSGFEIPKLKITDSPDLGYRGVLVDVSRKWTPMSVVLQVVDLMHLYKFNILQLHLSDDQLYVLPSKIYPQLPSVAKDGSRRHYTVKEIKKLNDYAAAHGVTILPEVEFPGHAKQLVLQLPEVFAFTDQNGRINRGNVINMVDEKAYKGVDNLIGEIIELFPNSEYIHIGADEVWGPPQRNIPTYQEYTKKHNLPEAQKGNVSELLCHFIIRANKMVEKRGRKSVVWEGFHGKGTVNAPVPTNILVLAWNTQYQTPQSLLANGFDIVNCTWLPLYIVPPQNRLHSQERTMGWNHRRWDHWKPGIKEINIPEKTKGILGAQICFWEQRHDAVVPMLSYLMPAVTERLWNPDSGTDYPKFAKKYDKIKEAVANVVAPVKIEAKGLVKNSDVDFADEVLVKLDSEVKGEIRYTLDTSLEFLDLPTKTSKVYTKPFKLDTSTTISAAIYDSKGNQVGGVNQLRFRKIVPTYHYQAYSAYEALGENHWPSFPDLKEHKPDRKGILGLADEERVKGQNRHIWGVKEFGAVNVRPDDMWNSFAVVMNSQVKLPETGTYEFKIYAKDGKGEIFIGGKKLVYNGIYGGEDHYSMYLEKGTYPLAITFMYRFLQNELNVQVKVPNTDEFIAFEDLVLPISEHIRFFKWRLSKVDESKLETVNLRHKKNWNYAVGRPVKIKEEDSYSKELDDRSPQCAVDGDTSNNSSWFGGNYPDQLYIDLETVREIDEIVTVFYFDGNRYYQYNIATSTDGIDWKELVDMTKNKAKSTRKGYTTKFKPTLARYVKITVTKNSVNRGVHLNEVMIYGPDLKKKK